MIYIIPICVFILYTYTYKTSSHHFRASNDAELSIKFVQYFLKINFGVIIIV